MDRENKKREVIINQEKTNYSKLNTTNKININALVRTKEQLICCIDNNIANIYITDYELYKENKHLKNIYYRIDRLDNKKALTDEKLLIGELGNIYKYKDNNELIGDYYLNVTNTSTIEYLSTKGLDKITLSVELDEYKIKDIMKKQYNTELIIYGRLELMLMKYCPLKKCLNHCHNCKTSQDKFYLENKLGARFPIIHNNCITHIMHSTNINKIKDINKYIDMGITNYRLELFDENYEEVKELINEIKMKLNTKIN